MARGEAVNPSPRVAPMRRSGLYAIAFSLLFVGAALLAHQRDWLDRPVVKIINHFAADQDFATEIAGGLAYPSVEGAVVVALIWYCWFSGISRETRARLASGVIAAVAAGLLAHVLQQNLSWTARPIFDQAIRLHLPHVLGDIEDLEATSNPGSSSFPSPRATMFAGLATSALLVRHRIGFIALACTTLVELSRIWLGLHYPVDLIGSFALAAAAVCFSQMRWNSELGLAFVRWEELSPPTFYMFLSLASYEMTVTFEDLRELAAQLL